MIKMTIEERAADIVGNRRFALRERKVMAQKIVDFMDIPAYGPVFKRQLSEYEKTLLLYNYRLQGLRNHCNAIEVLALIQTGRIA